MRYALRFARFVGTVAAVAAAGGLLSPSAATAGDTQIQPQITVTPSTIETDDTFTVNGLQWTACTADIIVVIENEAGTVGESVGTVLAADVTDGAWSLQSPAVPIPGTYTVRAYFDGCPLGATDDLTIVAAATTTTTTTSTTTTTTLAPTTLAPTTTQQIAAPVSTLPETGGPESQTAVMAAIALVLGAALIGIARRRPRAA